MKRRCQNGSLQQYAKPAYDFDENDTPATNDIIKAKTIEKIIVPLNQIQE